MSFFIKSLFGNTPGYTLWGAGLKLALLLACAAIVVLIVCSKRRRLFCKSCGKQISEHHKQCPECNTELAEETIGVKTGLSKKARTIGVLFTAIMLCLCAVGAIGLSQNITINNLATGVYSGYHQLYLQNDTMWGIECDSALSEGSFNHVIQGGDAPESITVRSSTGSGTLILNIKQNGTTESYDISNTDGEQQIDTAWLKPGQSIELSVEHTVADAVWFTLAW